MFLNRIRAAIAVGCLLLPTFSSIAQTVQWEVWNEKWPVNVSINPSNSIGVYLASNFGKLGEYAQKRLEKLLSDPAAQAKLSAKAIEYLVRLYNDPNLTQDEKAKRFIIAIEEDIGPYVSAPTGGLGMTVGYAAGHNVVRLHWNRVAERLACQSQSCICPDGSTRPGPGYSCYWRELIGGQWYDRSQPVACTFSTDTLDNEAQYEIYRNDKLLITYAESRNVVVGQSLPTIDFDMPFISGSLKALLPPSAPNPAVRAGPFFDYDPYNRVVGDPLSYRIVAKKNGCGAGYNNYAQGKTTIDTGLVLVDGNGDGRPDYYPLDAYVEKKNVGPFVGTKVAEHSDAGGKATVAVFERLGAVSNQHNKDFAVSVPADYVVIGGGAEGLELPIGHLLTASYPSSDLSSWYVSSKDNGKTSPTNAKVWAIGLKIAGLTRQQLLSNLALVQATSPAAQHPDVSVTLPADLVLLGGGFRANFANWSASGSLATASYPDTARSWRAKSKDHVIATSATLDVFAIGIRQSIAGIGTMQNTIQSVLSPVAPHPTATVSLPSGYALSGCGALANWSGAGSLLWRIKPLGATRQCQLGAMDHDVPSPASLSGYAIGFQVN